MLYELLILRHSAELAVYKAVLLLLGIIILQALWKGYKTGTIRSSPKQAGKTIVEGCVLGSRNMVVIALATAAAGIIIGVITMGLGGLITQIVETLAFGNIFLLLIYTALACIILGIGLPTTATYIVMASLTAPIIVSLGAELGLVIPLIAAHLFCFYFGILADDTPPVGVAAYAAASIAKSDPIKTGIQSFTYDIRDAIIPFMFILNTDLILYNITNMWLGILIGAMGILGALSFTSAFQGWLIIKNRWYEILILLLASLLFLNPGFASPLFGGAQGHYYGYLVALALLLCMVLSQKMRKRSHLFSEK